MQDRYSGLSSAIARSMDVAQLAGLELVERGLLLARRRRTTSLRWRPASRVRRAVDAHRLQLSPPQVIDRDVVGDLEQPARQLEFRPIAVEVVQDLDERVLSEVLGQLAVADHPIDEREDRPLVSTDQLAKRRRRALAGPARRRRRPGDFEGRGLVASASWRAPMTKRRRRLTKAMLAGIHRPATSAGRYPSTAASACPAIRARATFAA